MRTTALILAALVIVAGAGCNRASNAKAAADQRYANQVQAPRDALYRLKADIEIRTNPETLASHLSDAKVVVDRWQRGLSTNDANRTSAKRMGDTLTSFAAYADAEKFERETERWVYNDINSQAATAVGSTQVSQDAHAQAAARKNAARTAAFQSLDALDKAIAAGN